MPVFMVPADDDPDRVKSITAPSLSWNSSAGVTGDRPLLPVLRAAPLLRTCRFGEHDHQPLALVPRTTTTGARRTADAERPGAGAPQPLLPLLRARPRHDGRGRVELHAALRDRERARRLEPDLRPQPGGLRRGPRATNRRGTPSRDCPRRRSRIQTRPASTAPPSSAAASRFATTRASSATTAPVGFASELTGNVAAGITGVGVFGQLGCDGARARARAFVSAGSGALLLAAGHRRRQRAVLRSGQPGRRASCSGVSRRTASSTWARGRSRPSSG